MIVAPQRNEGTEFCSRNLGYTSTDNHETTRGPAAQLDFNYQAILDPASDGKPRSRAR